MAKMDNTGRSFHIYVDETSKSAKYFGVGAIFCRRDAAEQISSYMSDAVVRHEQRPEKELHWTELKGHLLPLYRDVGTTLVAYTQRPRPKMRYRALMVESQRIDRSLDEKANREDILAKFIFTLVYGFAADLGTNLDYHVFIDSPDGEEESSVSMQCALNNKCTSQLGCGEQPFKTVKYVRSENSRIIQATDLISGAVAYETNGLHLAHGAAKHRRSLWADMLEASKLETFAAPTKFFPKLFQIRHFDFKKSQFTRFKRSQSAAELAAIP